MAWKFIFHAVDYPDSDIRNEKEAGNIRFSEGKQFEGVFFFFGVRRLLVIARIEQMARAS